jgi:hypothetical protein
MCCAGQVAEEIEVEETYVLDPHGSPGREYCIRIRLTDPATYPPEAGVTFDQVPATESISNAAVPAGATLRCTSCIL